MKATIFLVVSLLTVQQSTAQHPLIGTWEMISVKGLDADGAPFSMDTTLARETKIITPTHYILIAWDVDRDSLIFNRTMAGKVRLDGEKYIEIPTQASVQIFENIDVDFTWKLKGDIFTQSGTIVRPDGKKVVLEALIFQRLKNAKPHTENPAIGTWKQVSSYYTTPDGENISSFNPSDERLLIVTPTHWMRMDHKNKEFSGVTYGTYEMLGDTVASNVIFSTYPAQSGDEVKFSQRIDGDKIHITSSGITPDGVPATFYDVLQREK